MLKLEHIRFSYDNNHVLNDVNASFRAGNIYGILGANGAGKTTLFQLMYGLEMPLEGNIQYQNKDIKRNQIGYLETQNYFYPYMKGREYLALLSQTNPTFDITLWNDLFDLPLDRLIDHYSTGMKKKLALLGILSLDRPVLLLDEPFQGLDLETLEYFSRILEEIKQQNKTIIISSHILQILKKNCDQISFLYNGRIKERYLKDQFDLIDDMIGKAIMQDADEILQHIFSSKIN